MLERTTDELIVEWLTEVLARVYSAFSISPIKISIQGYTTVQIDCVHRYMAQKVLSLSQDRGFGVKILVRGKIYKLIPSSKPMSNNISQNTTLQNSRWAMLNGAVLDLMSDDGTISIHDTDRDSGYRVLTVCPYQQIEQVLCLPKEQLVGKAALEAFDHNRPETEIIAQTKNRVIEEVIASRTKITHTYEMMWNGLFWQKSITGVLVDDEEVLCITRDLQDYQRKFWENFAR